MLRVRRDPAEACEVLQAVWERWEIDEFGHETAAGYVARHALSVIDKSAERALVGCGCLCEDGMKMVLGRQRIVSGEADLFKALQTWMAFDEEGRREAGGRLISCVDFQQMPPSFLRGTVAKSGLISEEVLCGVFEAQAVRAEGEHGFDFSTRGTQDLPKFCLTGTPVYACRASAYGTVLFDRQLRSGCWAWDLRVENTGGGLGVGVVAETFDDNIEWLVDRDCGYQFVEDQQNNGGYFHCYGRRTTGLNNGGGPLYSFENGDTIHVTLDFDSDGGTLSFGINDEEPVDAFAEIKLGTSSMSVTPAVSLMAPGRVRLLKFSKLR